MVKVQRNASVQTRQTERLTPALSGVLQRACACGNHASAGGECENCKQKREGTFQRAAINPSPVHDVPPIVHEVLRSPGQSLDEATRAFMEPRFGHDFSGVPTHSHGFLPIPARLTIGAPHDVFEQEAEMMAQQVMSRPDTSTSTGYDFSGVRIHTDDKAAESAQTVNALAYTVGHDMVFRAGQYVPETRAGQWLIAHELTHVVQQSVGSAPIAVARQPADASQIEQKDKPKAPPKAPKCDTGCAQRWGQDTTCSKWGFVSDVRDYGGKKWRGIHPGYVKGDYCCNSWPFALEQYAISVLGLNGAASCPVQHQKEIATIAYGEKTVDVLCSDTIPGDKVGETKSASACSGKIKTEVIEMSPKAMQDLSGQVASALHVSVCYGGSKQDLCLHNGPGKKNHPEIHHCLTEGCTPQEGTPKLKDTGWPDP